MKNPAEKMRFWHKVLLFAAAACVVAAFYGMERAQNVDFVCTNGDYQNYNALRRLLAGQVPYRDFANYLGMDLLLLCAPLLALHNTFAGSLFVTNFISVLTFILLVTLIFYLITGNKTVSALAGLLFPKLVSGQFFMLIPAYGYYTTYYLEMLMYPKNSFRSLRLFLPVLLCWLMLCVLRKRQTHIRRMIAAPKNAAVIAFLIGLFVTWSNDFGFACVGSASIVFLILSVANAAQGQGTTPRQIALNVVAWFAALFLGIAVSVFLASGGHPGAWLAYTKGVGSWQFWYFGTKPEDKILTLRQLFDWQEHHRTLLHWLMYAAAMGICLRRLCRKKDGDRLILAVFLTSSVVAGEMIYIFGSGGDNFEEGVCAAAILSFWAFAAKAGLILIRKLMGLPRFSLAALGLAACYIAYVGILDLQEGRELLAIAHMPTQQYIPALDGVSPQARALLEMSQTVGEDPLFATYASALDDMRGSFQPTGTDYIIHTLGDTRFADYVEKFDESNCKWVQTTNFKKWPWEAPLIATSWPFYHELFASYRLHSDHSYWTLWQYAGEDANVIDASVEVRLVQHSGQEVEIRVTSPEKRACYVDVAVDWRTDTVPGLQRLQTFHTTVFVTDTAILPVYHGVGTGYFRPVSAKQHLVIYMCGGEGSIRLTSMPQSCTTLTVQTAEAGDVILREAE